MSKELKNTHVSIGTFSETEARILSKQREVGKQKVSKKNGVNTRTIFTLLLYY